MKVLLGTQTGLVKGGCMRSIVCSLGLNMFSQR